ncbi:MAG: Formamidase, partial [Rhizobacter sp.]|nr:Formamidase [Rhizobacter sp.]
PYIVHWELNRLEARSKDMPGIVVPNNAFMGTVGVLPGKPELDTWLKREKALADAGGAVLVPQPVDALPSSLCGVDGTAKDECVRTVPPRENGCPIRLARERRQGARAPTPDAPLAEPIAATTCTWARLKT